MTDMDVDSGGLQQMYQEVILEAARDPHGKKHFTQDVASESDDSSAQTTLSVNHEYCTVGQSHQFNPTCGDETTVHVEISRKDPRRIVTLAWDGHGCSISQASLSVMTDLVSGRTVDEAMNLSHWFHQLMQSRGKGIDDDAAEEALGDAIVFQGVSLYPMRIKCALLGWEGLRDSLAKALADPGSGTAARANATAENSHESDGQEA